MLGQLPFCAKFWPFFMNRRPPLTILIGTESYYPTISGVAVFSRQLALELIKRGHKVHIICPSTRFKSYSESDNGILVHRIRAIKNPFRPRLKVSFFPRRDVVMWFHRIQPDVAHLQDPTSICSEIIRMCNKTQTKSVMTNHFAFEYVLSYLPWLKFYHRPIAQMLEKYLIRMYNRCDFVTFPSNAIRQKFGHHKLKVPSLAISNGVDLDQFFPSYNFEAMKMRFHLPNKPLILYVGRLDQDKKTGLIIDAFAKMKQNDRHHLIICGEGNKKNRLMQKARRLNLTKHITFINFINHQTELPQLYQMATVFTTASTIETQGVVVLEAMASGLPIVAPNAGALPELVHDGQNGYLFKPDDVGDLAAKLSLILHHPSAARKMGEQSLALVGQHEVSLSIDKFERIYYNILKP